MHQPVKILALCGSTRQTSVNMLILQGIQQRFAGKLHIEIFNSLAVLPHFSPDLLGDALPDVVNDFYEKLAGADGVVICSPEYVFSVPGVLKNAIEWTVSTVLFSDKPTAIIVASSLGEKTFESLQLIMTTLGVKTNEDIQLLISGSNSKIDKDTHTVNHEVLQQLDALMDALVKLIVR